jgi:hypothetical protein
MTDTAPEHHHPHHPSEEPDDEAARKIRQVTGILVIAGVAMAAGIITYLVIEQWRANRAALRTVTQEQAATVTGFPVAKNGSTRRPPPDPGPSHRPSDLESPAPGPYSSE